MNREGEPGGEWAAISDVFGVLRGKADQSGGSEGFDPPGLPHPSRLLPPRSSSRPHRCWCLVGLADGVPRSSLSQPDSPTGGPGQHVYLCMAWTGTGTDAAKALNDMSRVLL